MRGLTLSAAIFAVNFFMSFASDSDPLVNINDGAVRGIVAKSRNGQNFFSFRGIPYAQPPVGDLRFKAPKPPLSWNEVLEANRDSPKCIQKNTLFYDSPVEGEEDCLYINVYTPQLTGSSYPLNVMVYIHEGGFFFGSGISSVIGPEYFMDHNVVLVTFNYRLGAFGFLSTKDKNAPGNMGLKDQLAALRWVRDNIHAFGGNPYSVTIFGQSAGAGSVHYHILSSLSKGLFHKAISQSGNAISPWSIAQEPLPAVQQLAGFVGCPNDLNDTATIVSCLRKVDAKILAESIVKFRVWSVDPMNVYFPVVETDIPNEEAFITMNPLEQIRKGKIPNRVPWILGQVENEGTIRATAILENSTDLTNLNQAIDTLMPALMNLPYTMPADKVPESWLKLKEFYFNNKSEIGSDNAQGLIDIYGDRGFLYGLYNAAVGHSLAGHDPIYMYRFVYKGKYSYTPYFSSSDKVYGVGHCDDLIYLFRNPSMFPDFPLDHPDVGVSETLISLWTTFAKYGNPTPRLKPDSEVYKKIPPSFHWLPIQLEEVNTNSNTSRRHLRYLNIEGPVENQLEDKVGCKNLKLSMEDDLFPKGNIDLWKSLPLYENKELQKVMPTIKEYYCSLKNDPNQESDAEMTRKILSALKQFKIDC